MTLPVIVIGTGGHAKVLVEALRRAAIEILGCVDREPVHQAADLRLPFIGPDESITRFSPESIRLVNGIGSIGNGQRRREVYERFYSQGYRFADILHPSTVIAADTILGEGIQVMAGTIIQPGCRIGANVLLNTRTLIDHDCIIGDHVHVAPGAVLSGGVVIGESAHVGTGAAVIQDVVIGARAVIAAGAAVISDVSAGLTVGGVPARPLLPKKP
ncbi:MAG: acetyltransferase [Rhodospirillales bacterium]|nr:acetyltransferase [Rhodospirillales bacterium]